MDNIANFEIGIPENKSSAIRLLFSLVSEKNYTSQK